MQVAQSGDSSQESLSILPSSWVPAFRIAVILIILVHLFLFSVAVPLDYQNKLNDIAASDISERFADAGISPEFFAAYLTGVTVLAGLLFTIIGILILIRRPQMFMPLFVALVLVVEGTQITGLFYALDSIGAIGRWTADISDAFSSTLLVMFFFIFPTGHFVPRWTRWVVLGVILFGTAGIFLKIRDPLLDYPGLTLVSLALIFSIMFYAQIHRYRRVRTMYERQQVKWVVVGMLAALSLFLVAVIATAMNPDRGPYEIMFWFTLVNIGLLMIPISIAVAILRYRLFEIDRLINKTLVYSSLTVVLGGVYTLSVMGLQALLGSIAGSSGVAVALSTLIAVAMFKPARARIQNSVDRRFFRTRYDAAEILGRFSMSVRDEVHLEMVQRLLSQTIDGAVRPSRMTFWMQDLEHAHRGMPSETRKGDHAS
jgi:hypothetical protein